MGHTHISFWERLYNIVLLRTYFVSLPGKYTQRLRRAGLASAAVPLRGPRPQPAVCFLSSIKWPRTDHAMPFPPQARAIGMAWRRRWTCQQSCHHQTILTFVYFALLESGFMATVFENEKVENAVIRSNRAFCFSYIFKLRLEQSENVS